VKYFPLTRSLCLRLGDTGSAFEFRRVDRETVRLINQNIAANSERFIMGSVRLQLETIVSRSGSTQMDSSARFTVEKVEEDESGSIDEVYFSSSAIFLPKEWVFAGTLRQRLCEIPRKGTGIYGTAHEAEFANPTASPPTARTGTTRCRSLLRSAWSAACLGRGRLWARSAAGSDGRDRRRSWLRPA